MAWPSTHGHTIFKKGKKVKSLTYNSWEAMNRRCTDPDHPYYDDYGGRGIEVCERWRRGSPNAFINFLADMGERPDKKHTIDRERVNEGYNKDNCRWSDKKTQRLNQRPKAVATINDDLDDIPF